LSWRRDSQKKCPDGQTPYMKYYRVRTAPVMPKSKGGREKGIEDTRACKRSQKQKRTLQTVRLPTAQHFGWLKNDSLIL
jgi:hypothetical protein